MSSKTAGVENAGSWHYPDPDYTRPLYKVDKRTREAIEGKLAILYGRDRVEGIFGEILRLMQVYYSHKTPAMIEWEKTFRPSERFSERDAVLITYGDLIRARGEMPLDSMADITRRYFKGVFNTLHILPFFPYSSDRGFAVIDFTQVDRNLGTWDNIIELKSDFRLMFDGVFNHVSSQSPWFKEFLNGHPEFRDFFTAFAEGDKIPEEDLKMLFRPRTSSVLSEYDTIEGRKRVWTTFSRDQIDLRFQNPKVLLKILEILLLYVRKGADMMRLDAVTYLWDELGTTGVHMEQTHQIIRLLRCILDAVAPHVALVTETNVPHKENISYFGDGTNEAQMVYNFALPPLVLHTFQTGSSERLTQWAGSIRGSAEATYLNFLDSHDGVGVMGARGILSDAEIEEMARRVTDCGGEISRKTDSDGRESIYELNVTSYSALNPEGNGEDVEIQIRRYLAARSIPLVLTGVPGIYLHGLLGSRNDIEAIRAGQEKRNINRKNLDKGELISALNDASSVTARIVKGFVGMLKIRSGEPAFHPAADQRVIEVSDSLFCVLRSAVNGERILAVVNVTGSSCEVSLNTGGSGLNCAAWKEFFSGELFDAAEGRLVCRLEQYAVKWFKARD